jgi:hypothetical protein
MTHDRPSSGIPPAGHHQQGVPMIAPSVCRPPFPTGHRAPSIPGGRGSAAGRPRHVVRPTIEQGAVGGRS